ncbi:siderophore-interacting protein [Kaistia algarum]|uniref:siderophore-interacting protein n=1 Tax=Kaistia algarum TaxID=2083279 RepID=UPI001A9C7BD6|nr:siderophore-interacting protein [Kaistia algarum]MCX5513501.1 siderophore-interacting protein [Kaistia algarum]
MAMDIGTEQRHAARRVRHETRRRLLTVKAIEDVTPRMRRITFSADTMEGFESLAPDDHIKLFFAAPEGPQMRDFTPRRFDREAGTLVIDFALHEAGPATSFAAGARIGDPLEIGGPRGSAVVADDFDWYWLIGDETALPAIGRWLEEARPGLPILTAIAIADASERQAIETKADWTTLWSLRSEAGTDDAAAFIALLAGQPLPPGDGFIFIAAETNVARAVRRYLTEERGHLESWMKAAGYWKRGEADAHERIED